MTTDFALTHRTRLALAAPVSVDFRRVDVQETRDVRRERLEYHGLAGDVIPAFLFTPINREPLGGVVVFHQHNGEFHFGKSEVAGDVGDPYQAFGPALARRGVAVLAPDTSASKIAASQHAASNRDFATGSSTTTRYRIGCSTATR